jgi:hypothetical protein
MERPQIVLICVAAVCLSQVARADFKYTETSRVTGGMMAGMLKFAGAFSKNANAPVVSTVYVKGNRLRRDSADRSAEIIDLGARRVIAIDNEKHTYSVATFDEIRQALQQAQQKMQQNMKDQKAQITLSPKFDVTPTGSTRDILGQPTREVKVKVEMEMQAQGKSDDGKQQNASGTITMASDMWVAPSVAGYHEITEFYKRMAKEIDWVPTSGMILDPRAAKGMQELQKNSSQMQGLPLIQYISMYLGTTPQGQGTATSGAQPQGDSQSAPQGSSATSGPNSPTDAAVKALGALGGFGGFGRRKKKHDQQSDQASAGSSAGSSSAPAPPSNPGSFMDLTTEVTAFSGDTLNPSLFEIPAGYDQVKSNPEQILGGGRKR